MKLNDNNQTKQWLVEALLELLQYKNYHSITIQQIVNKANLGRRTFYHHFKTKDEVIECLINSLMAEFAKTIIENNATTLQTIIEAYFKFWENYVDIIILLNKAHLLYFIEDNLQELLLGVALKVDHLPQNISDEEKTELLEAYKFDFAIKLAGLWKATVLWSEEKTRRTPPEMSLLVSKIFIENKNSNLDN